jgi:parallel beta-helix repeat protein
VVQGNYIGTNAAGTAALGNDLDGVIDFGGHNTLIGGSVSGAGNVISANGQDGVLLFGSTGSAATVQGNKIGTAPDGSGSLGNGQNGIEIFGPDSNTIGGTGLASNLIAFSNLDGVHILDSTGNLIRGNVIQHNGGQGVDAETGPNTVSGNLLINDDEGVRVEPTATGVRIVGNQMINNGGLGINLIGGTQVNHGVTENDTDDPDTGANNLQNFPVIAAAIRHTSNGVTNITGSLNSNPNTAFRIELFVAVADVSGHGEAQFLVAAANFTTNAGGDVGFAFGTTQLVAGQTLTATATSVTAGNSSEFSANVVVAQQP